MKLNAAALLTVLCGVSGLAAPAPRLRVPARFEANAGQWDKEVRFLARLGGGNIALTPAGPVVPIKAGREVRIGFSESNTPSSIEGIDERKSATNYFIGGKNNWRANVRQFGRVRYREIYKGIDVDYYLTGGKLEFDFIVRPGAEPEQIRMRFTGADSVRIQEGAVEVAAGGERMRQLPPAVYQETARGERHAVTARYELSSANEVRLRLGGYDRSRTLVIDPVLVYSSYLGGVDADLGSVIAVDQSGKIWIAGNTTSQGLPERAEAYQATKSTGQDVFIARFNPQTSGEASLEMLTYLGGTGSDEVKGIDIGPSGFIALAGSTTSTDFPMAGNTYKNSNTGERDVFIALLNPFETGPTLLSYSTYLGGAALDFANGVAIDDKDNIYVTGYTTSDDFPLTDNRYIPIRRGGYDAFVSRITPSLPAEQTLSFSTYFGTESTDVGMAIAADSAGFIYVGGYTFAPDFPLAGNPFNGSHSGKGDAFIVKLDPSKGFPDTQVYGTYFGGSEFEKLFSLKIDRAGGVVVAGYTNSDDFPLTGSAFQRQKSGADDVFVARFDLSRPPAQQLTYSTYLGGSDTDVLYGAALDGSGRVVITGYTLSPDFPVKGTSSYQNGFGGGIDAFVAWLDPAASGANSLLSSAFVGGTDIDAGYAVAADARGRAYITGFTGSTNLPLTGSAVSSAIAGIWDSFVTALDF